MASLSGLVIARPETIIEVPWQSLGSIGVVSAHEIIGFVRVQGLDQEAGTYL